LSSDRLGAGPAASLATGALTFEDELRPLLGQALGLATAMLLNPSEAEDAVQEAALRAWRRRGNRRPNTDLRPWFLAIVANQCREVRRGRWAAVLRFADPPAGVTAGGDREGLLDLRRALLGLPRDARLALVLRYYVDLPIDEVAAVLNCSVDAAKSRVRRGVASLGSLLMSSEDLT
jgi:RNA polymerase sigma-70 factor (ECF subfamily)